MITAMETTASKIENPVHPAPPVRILVQTLTHLVPGGSHIERMDAMLNLICRHVWDCDFQAPEFRWAGYNLRFAFSHKRCFFVVDHGESQDGSVDVPVLSYEWTGETL